MLLGGTWTRKKSKFGNRLGPNKAVHGGFFSKKQCLSMDVYSALQISWFEYLSVSMSLLSYSMWPSMWVALWIVKCQDISHLCNNMHQPCTSFLSGCISQLKDTHLCVGNRSYFVSHIIDLGANEHHKCFSEPKFDVLC